MSRIRPQFEITIYPWLSGVPGRNYYLTSEEQAAFRSAVELPPGSWSQLEVRDDLSTPGFSLTIPGGAYKQFKTQDGKLIRIDELLAEGAIVGIREKGKRFFAGYVENPAESAAVDAPSADLTISGAGIDGAMRNQTVFIDSNARPSDANQQRSVASVAQQPAARFTSAIANFASTIQNLRSAALVISRLVDVLREQLLSGGKYGGKKFEELYLAGRDGLSMQTYTQGFVHVINWMGSVNFGATISYWDMLSTFATSPLYELFTHHGHTDVYVNSNQTLSPGDELGNLVFRPTPWAFLEQPPDDPSLVFTLKPDQIKRVRFNRSLQDLASGFHVSLGDLMDVGTGTLVNPVTYLPAVLEQFGQRVYPTTLSGLQFPEQDDGTQSSLAEKLRSLQDDMARVFRYRNVSGSFDIAYNSRNGLAKGMILNIPGDAQELPLSLRRYEGRFYCTGVTTTVRPESGTLDQSVEFKWGRKRSRGEQGVSSEADLEDAAAGEPVQNY